MHWTNSYRPFRHPSCRARCARPRAGLAFASRPPTATTKPSPPAVPPCTPTRRTVRLPLLRRATSVHPAASAPPLPTSRWREARVRCPTWALAAACSARRAWRGQRRPATYLRCVRRPGAAPWTTKNAASGRLPTSTRCQASTPGARRPTATLFLAARLRSPTHGWQPRSKLPASSGAPRSSCGSSNSRACWRCGRTARARTPAP
mmetsp:Transcript_5349/g.17241  ORF Transcript_5349/g.17241 Transcript_5349/m.17241 type:complete len:205 (-) Transcript_5349:1507-2121(-)